MILRDILYLERQQHNSDLVIKWIKKAKIFLHLKLA